MLDFSKFYYIGNVIGYTLYDKKDRRNSWRIVGEDLKTLKCEHISGNGNNGNCNKMSVDFFLRGTAAYGIHDYILVAPEKKFDI